MTTSLARRLVDNRFTSWNETSSSLVHHYPGRDRLVHVTHKAEYHPRNSDRTNRGSDADLNGTTDKHKTPNPSANPNIEPVASYVAR